MITTASLFHDEKITIFEFGIRGTFKFWNFSSGFRPKFWKKWKFSTGLGPSFGAEARTELEAWSGGTQTHPNAKPHFFQNFGHNPLENFQIFLGNPNTQSL